MVRGRALSVPYPPSTQLRRRLDRVVFSDEHGPNPFVAQRRREKIRVENAPELFRAERDEYGRTAHSDSVAGASMRWHRGRVRLRRTRGGGTAYTALLALLGASHVMIPTVSLLLNIIGTTIGSFIFLRARHGRFVLIAPFVAASGPAAYVGGCSRFRRTSFTDCYLRASSSWPCGSSCGMMSP